MAKQSTIIVDLIDAAILVNNATPYQSANIELDKTSGQFSVQLNYDNGTTPVFDMIAEFSNDGVQFSNQDTKAFTAVSGSALFDYPAGSGATFMRIRVVAASGNMDLTELLFRAKEIR